MEALNPNDYNPHDNHVGQILGIQTVVFILAMSCVVMRLYVRIRIIKSTGVDDWTMGGAAVSLSFPFLLFPLQPFSIATRNRVFDNVNIY